ncbi:MAG: HAD family hydrolase [Rubrivivax sp.]
MIAPLEIRMKNRRFDLIAFDWDGTLFDSTALIVRCIQGACRDVGTTVPDDERAAYVIGLGLRDALMHAAPDFPAERYAELAQAYRRHYFAAQHEVVLFEGTLAMLQELRGRSHLLAVATGKSRRGLDEALGTTQLHTLFDATRTADETASKPHPQMLLELMAELGVAPARTLMIGDTTHDLEMATRAGVTGLGVSYGAHAHTAFAAHAPVFVAHTTAELHAWLLEHA